MSRFVEATMVYRPLDSNEEKTEKRLINLDDVRLITKAKDYSMFHMRAGSSPSVFVVTEGYEYWQLVLTSDQPQAAYFKPRLEGA